MNIYRHEQKGKQVVTRREGLQIAVHEPTASVTYSVGESRDAAIFKTPNAALAAALCSYANGGVKTRAAAKALKQMQEQDEKTITN